MTILLLIRSFSPADFTGQFSFRLLLALLMLLTVRACSQPIDFLQVFYNKGKKANIETYKS